MYSTVAYRVRQVVEEHDGFSSVVEFHETRLWCDHIPDKSEIKGYWVPYAWDQIIEPNLFSDYMADVQQNVHLCKAHAD